MDGIGKLALPFGNNSKAKRHVDEAAKILADAEQVRRAAASQARTVQQKTREIVDLISRATEVDVREPHMDYPVTYLLVDKRRAAEAVDAWRREAENEVVA